MQWDILAGCLGLLLGVGVLVAGVRRACMMFWDSGKASPQAHQMDHITRPAQMLSSSDNTTCTLAVRLESHPESLEDVTLKSSQVTTQVTSQVTGSRMTHICDVPRICDAPTNVASVRCTETASGTPAASTESLSLRGMLRVGTGPRPLYRPCLGAPLEERKKYLAEQLNTLTGTAIHGSKVVLGPRDRMHGGQSIVQMVEDVKTRRQYAAKFFLSYRAYKHELQLYEDPHNPLGQFLPELLCHIDTGVQDSGGGALPPFLLMEKGEPLDTWLAGQKLDSFGSLQVLAHIAERCGDLHAAGWVHRDIKPANIMMLPQQKRWTLMDFGIAAKAGAQARLQFTKTYAPPEVLQAACSGKQHIVATGAMDAWSLGILGIEMFTGKRAFPKDSFTDSQVMAMIVGQQQLPWEASETAQEYLKPLGGLRSIVLQLLHRDPLQRMNAAQCAVACRRLVWDNSIDTGEGDNSIDSGGKGAPAVCREAL